MSDKLASLKIESITCQEIVMTFSLQCVHLGVISIVGTGMLLCLDSMS